MGTANGDCRLLDAMFAALGSAQLTHELLVTLMAEVTAIVNARPIVLVPKKTKAFYDWATTGIPDFQIFASILRSSFFPR